MGNCSSADRRTTFMRKRGNTVPTDDYDVYAYGKRNSLDKTDERETLMQAEENGTDKSVVPSDSGIESIGPSTDDSPETECKKCSRQKLNQYDPQITTDCGLKSENYCSCGPRIIQSWQDQGPRIFQSWQENVQCKTHPNSPKYFRHSDFIDVKPSSFKINKCRERRSHFSCKSSDSLDYAGAMMTSMDNAKSVVSDIFGDDVSLRAPLAAFDSIDGHMDTDEISRRERSRSQIEDLTNRLCPCVVFGSNQDNIANQNACDTLASVESLHIRNSLISASPDVRNSLIRDSPERKVSCINGFADEVFRTSFSRKNRNSNIVRSFVDGVETTSVVSKDEVESQCKRFSAVSLQSPVKKDFIRKSLFDSDLFTAPPGLKIPAEGLAVAINGQEVIIMNMNSYDSLLHELHTLKCQLSALSDLLQIEI